MAGDIDNLAGLMKRISTDYRYGSEITIYGLKKSIIEVMARGDSSRKSLAGYGERLAKPIGAMWAIWNREQGEGLHVRENTRLHASSPSGPINGRARGKAKAPTPPRNAT